MNKNTIAFAGTATIAASSIVLNVKQGATLAIRAKQITLKNYVIKVAMDELLKVGPMKREIKDLRRQLGLARHGGPQRLVRPAVLSGEGEIIDMMAGQYGPTPDEAA